MTTTATPGPRLRKWDCTRDEVRIVLTERPDDAGMVRLNQAVRAFSASLCGEPDLLEACLAALPLMESEFGAYGPREPETRCIELLRAAIAKTEGRPQ